jgi:hypothetical protein
MFNDSNNVALDAWTDRELHALAKRATKNGKVRLSYFEREQVIRLGKAAALDANGNYDLNLAANLSTQLGNSTRVNPNSLVGALESSQFVTKTRGGNTIVNPEVSAKASCARNHQRNGRDVQGFTNCNYCKGAGFLSAELQKSGSISNKSRNNVGD